MVGQRNGLLRLDHHLEDTLQPLSKDFVSLLNMIERHSMSNQRCQVDAMMPDHLDKTTHPFFPSRAEGCHDAMISDPGGERFIRDLELPGIYAKTGKRAAGSEAA